MRLVLLLTSCSANADRLDAVLDTWARELPRTDVLLILGDPALQRTHGTRCRVEPTVAHGRCWEGYEQLPFKVRHGFGLASSLPWDWLLKVDDDSYVDIARVRAHLSTLPLDQPLYAGNGYHIEESHEARAEYVLMAGGGFRYHSGGGGYALNRRAFEDMWPMLRVALCREGPEDLIVGAVASAAGVRVECERLLYDPDGSPDGVLYGATAVAHRIDPVTMRWMHAARLAAARDRVVFASARLRRGNIGTRGRLAARGSKDYAMVDGRPATNAIAAPAPSRVVLALAPRTPLTLRGTYDDSVSGEGLSASFDVTNLAGRRLAALGEAGPGRPTRVVSLRVPDDGRVALIVRGAPRDQDRTLWLLQDQA